MAFLSVHSSLYWTVLSKISQLAMLEKDKHDLSFITHKQELWYSCKDSDILFHLFVHSLC